MRKISEAMHIEQIPTEPSKVENFMVGVNQMRDILEHFNVHATDAELIDALRQFRIDKEVEDKEAEVN